MNKTGLFEAIATGRVRLENREVRLSIVVAGDLCPMGRAEALLCAGDSSTAFAAVRQHLSASDFGVVNLECPLTLSANPISKTGPSLRAHPQCANAIHAAGFRAVSLANNHILDMGPSGLEETLAACKQAGLKTVGAGSNLTEAQKPLFFERNGLTIALLALAEHEFSIATSTSAGAWPLDPIDNFHQIRDARQRADFVLVILHGGHEYYALPSPAMVKTCRFLVDSGADAVVCHHTHTPSGIEVYRGAPIVYSIGNFLFDWADPKPEAWYTGYLVALDVTQHAVVQLRLIPYWQCRGDPLVRLMSDSEAAQFCQRIAVISETVADEGALTKEWKQFCSVRRIQYLSVALSLTRIERKLMASGIWPTWRLRRTQIPGLLNLATCESHRDVVVSVLQAELEGEPLK